MLRSFDPGASFPGIDTPVGSENSGSDLATLDSIPTDGAGQPFYYNSSQNTVYVLQDGADLSGYDLGAAHVVALASHVAIENCTFEGTTGYTAVTSWNGADDITVTNCTFTGDAGSNLGVWIRTSASVTVTDNAFIDTPCDGVDVSGGGVISGNYFSEAGNDAGGHADAIWISNSSAPMTISDNFIDWTLNPAATVDTVNNAIRITAEMGRVANLTVTGNAMIGGTASIQAVGNPGDLSNVSIADNAMGFARFYAFYPGAHPGVTESDNVVFDWTNPSWSTDAWNAYLSAGSPTGTLVTASGGYVAAGAVPGPVTLYAGETNVVMTGGAYETNFVGGYGAQHIWAGSGANIFTYLSVGDSTRSSPDDITNFDPAKDVIDLSRIDGDVATPGLQTFAFIGTKAFDGDGPEVRTEQNSNGTTSVQAALAGDTTPDLQITLRADLTLTAANFVLTDSESGAALAIAARLAAALREAGHPNAGDGAGHAVTLAGAGTATLAANPGLVRGS